MRTGHGTTLTILLVIFDGAIICESNG